MALNLGEDTTNLTMPRTRRFRHETASHILEQRVADPAATRLGPDEKIAQ